MRRSGPWSSRPRRSGRRRWRTATLPRTQYRPRRSLAASGRSSTGGSRRTPRRRSRRRRSDSVSCPKVNHIGCRAGYVRLRFPRGVPRSCCPRVRVVAGGCGAAWSRSVARPLRGGAGRFTPPAPRSPRAAPAARRMPALSAGSVRRPDPLCHGAHRHRGTSGGAAGLGPAGRSRGGPAPRLAVVLIPTRAAATPTSRLIRPT